MKFNGKETKELVEGVEEVVASVAPAQTRERVYKVNGEKVEKIPFEKEIFKLKCFTEWVIENEPIFFGDGFVFELDVKTI